MARIVSALILIPAVLALVIYARPIYFLISLGILGTACLYEYFQLIRSMGIRPQPWLGYIAFWALLAAFRQSRFPVTILIALVLLAAFLAAMWRQCPVRERALGMMANLSGVFYLALFLYPALPLRFDFGNKLGMHWFIILLVVIWIGDTAALIIGKKFGRSLFAPVISPNKTNEGAAGGLLAGVVAASLMQHFIFTYLPLRHVIVVSLLLGMFGQLGDLAESMLKRAAEVKDSSHMIPGHGGVLDRVDSLLFAFPVLYFYLLHLYA